MAAVKALQQWCRIQCEGYRDVAITNMTTSFRDGLAFCALIHKQRPDLIQFDSLKKENVYENNKLAFQVAEQELGIPALLDAEDMVALRVPDRLSILTYVSQYYNYFHGRSPIGGMGGIKRPAEAPTDEPSGKKNQAVTAKVFPSSKPARENSPPTSPNIPRPSPGPRQTETGLRAVGEKPPPSGTLSNRCVVCDKHVHLVQRHLVEGKLYHRSCAKSQSSTNASSPLRPLPTNTPALKFTPPPDSTKTSTTAPTQTPSRLAPASQTEKIGTPSNIFGTPTTSVPSQPGTGLSSTANRSPTPFVSKPASSQATGGTAFTKTTTPTISTPTINTPTISTQPSAAPRSSATAAKTQEAKLKFLQGESTPDREEKKTTTIKVDVNKGKKAPGKVPEAKVGQAQTVVVNIGGAGKKETSATGGEKVKAAAVGGGAKAKQDDKEANKTKSSAAAFISKKLNEEANNNNNNKPAWANVALKKTDKPPAPVETPKRETGAVKGRVKLKVNPSILADLEPQDNTTSSKSKTPDRGGLKPGSPTAVTAPETESPSDWRSKLKPVGKETKPAGPSQSPKPSEVPVRPSSPPLSKGFQNGQNDKTANGGKSNVPKTKPDFIPKAEIIKELQEIEDNLNELEKRGVELELKLRQSDEEGEDDSLMVEWFNLIRNKQVAMRRESELNYIDKTQDLEQEQPGVEQELRRLMEKPEHLKTALDRKREKELMSKLLEIVHDRNAIIEVLDEDRLREEEEDQQMDQLMKDLNIKKDKTKKKSPMAKLFSWGNKKEKEKEKE